MEGTIMNFRQGRHTITPNQMIVVVDSIADREKASKLTGKKVIFITLTGKKIVGEIRSAHGNKGALRVLFEKGLPGQALARKVTIE
jgi:large subunit ribosomal protein L35Ae